MSAVEASLRSGDWSERLYEGLRPVLDVAPPFLATNEHLKRLEQLEVARRINEILDAGTIQGHLTRRQSMQLALLAGDLAKLVLAP